MMGTLFLFLAVLVVAAGLLSRVRYRRVSRGEETVGSDAFLKELLGGEGGAEDEGVDEDEIREAEDRFWEEDWDEPEEWRG
jgi:hypothetical protein